MKDNLPDAHLSLIPDEDPYGNGEPDDRFSGFAYKVTKDVAPAKPDSGPSPFTIYGVALIGLFLYAAAFMVMTVWVIYEGIFGAVRQVNQLLERVPLERICRSRLGEVLGTVLFMAVFVMLCWFCLDAYLRGAFEGLVR